MAPAILSPVLAGWRWLRATIDDPNRAAWLYVPTTAFLPLTFGSVATFFFFGACIYIGLIWLFGRLRWVWPPTTAFGCLVALAYFATVLVTALLAPDPLRGLWDAGTALHYAALILLVGAFVQTPRVDVFELTLNGLRAGAIVSCLHALVQVTLFGHPRATAGMANAIPFGDAAVLAAGLSMVGFARLSGRMRLFAVLATVAGIVGCLLSQTRGAMIAVPFAVAVVAIHLWPMIRARAGQALALAAGLATIAIVAGSMARVPDRVGALITSVNVPDVTRSADPSTADRAAYWAFGLEAFMERPLLGYGPQNAVPEVRRRAAAAGVPIGLHTHLHSEFLDAAVGSGLAGLMAMLMLLAAPIVIAVRSPPDDRQPERIAFAVLLSGCYAIFGLTNTLFGQDQMNTLFAFLYVVMVVASHQASIGLARILRPFMGVPPRGVTAAVDHRER